MICGDSSRNDRPKTRETVVLSVLVGFVEALANGDMNGKNRLTF